MLSSIPAPSTLPSDTPRCFAKYCHTPLLRQNFELDTAESLPNCWHILLSFSLRSWPGRVSALFSKFALKYHRHHRTYSFTSQPVNYEPECDKYVQISEYYNIFLLQTSCCNKFLYTNIHGFFLISRF